MATLSEQDRADIAAAVAYLEQPSFLFRIADTVGQPAHALMGRVPARVQQVVAKATEKALHQALNLAIYSLGDQKSQAPSPGLHAASAAAVGGLGGLLGLATLPLELPVSTALMLRSIAEIARTEGADLSDPEVRLECLSVLALGGKMPAPIDAQVIEENGALQGESGYWQTRLGLSLALRSAAHALGGAAGRGVVSRLAVESSPVLMRLLGLLAARFQVVVGEKAMAQALPVLGAATGAMLNAAFADHYNQVARHHFRLRRLERMAGAGAVQQAYLQALRDRQSRLPNK